MEQVRARQKGGKRRRAGEEGEESGAWGEGRGGREVKKGENHTKAEQYLSPEEEKQDASRGGWSAFWVCEACRQGVVCISVAGSAASAVQPVGQQREEEKSAWRWQGGRGGERGGRGGSRLKKRASHSRYPGIAGVDESFAMLFGVDVEKQETKRGGDVGGKRRGKECPTGARTQGRNEKTGARNPTREGGEGRKGGRGREEEGLLARSCFGLNFRCATARCGGGLARPGPVAEGAKDLTTVTYRSRPPLVSKMLLVFFFGLSLRCVSVLLCCM